MKFILPGEPEPVRVTLGRDNDGDLVIAFDGITVGYIFKCGDIDTCHVFLNEQAALAAKGVTFDENGHVDCTINEL